MGVFRRETYGKVEIKDYRIYKLIDPLTKETRYIGRTGTSLKQRLEGHIDAARYRGYDVTWAMKNKWVKSLLNQGLMPIIEEIEEIRAEEKQALKREFRLICAHMQQGCKLTNCIANEQSLIRAISLVRGNIMDDRVWKRCSWRVETSGPYPMYYLDRV